MTVAEALARHLRERYPQLGFHPLPDYHAGYTHIYSDRNCAVILLGSKVFLTTLRRRGQFRLPPGYRPDIDLCEPDSLERIYRWLDIWVDTARNGH